MAKSDLKIKANDSRTATSVTTTISYINPAASNGQLATLGAMINSFTTNVYDHSEKVTTVNVDGEAGGGKTAPTLQLVTSDTQTVITNFNTTRGTGNARDDENCDIQYTGDGDLTITLPPVGCNVCFYRTPNNKIGMVTMASSSLGAQTGTFNFTIYAAETDNYQAASFDFTVTITA